MPLKSVVAWLAATTFIIPALAPSDAFAGRGSPSWGTWNWPPYAGSGGGMPGKSMCSYVRAKPDGDKPGKGQWFYECQ
jgi:hypothetical protein